MPLHSNEEYSDRLIELMEKLRSTQAVTPDLMADVISGAGGRLALLNKGGKAATHVTRLLDSSAWIDASLALLALELPGWKLRRLVYDGGEWHCSLSKQPNLPIEIDDTADARHEILPLAILSALLDAQHRRIAHEIAPATVPQVRAARAHVFCCDNFA